MPLYTVVCRGHLLHNKKPHPTGSTVEMTEAQALSLPPGTVERVKDAPVPAPKPDAPPPTPKPSIFGSKKDKS